MRYTFAIQTHFLLSHFFFTSFRFWQIHTISTLYNFENSWQFVKWFGTGKTFIYVAVTRVSGVQYDWEWKGHFRGGIPTQFSIESIQTYNWRWAIKFTKFSLDRQLIKNTRAARIDFKQERPQYTSCRWAWEGK